MVPTVTRLRAALRAALSLGVAAQMACLPAVKERCRLVTEPTSAPALPPGLAELDGLLIRRATEMTQVARELESALVWNFRLTFAGTTLPILCDRLERARALAMAGRTAEAGRTYQALLVASQVLQMDVAMHAMAQYADRSRQSSFQIEDTLKRFAAQVAPIFEAALSEDPRRIERALDEHGEAFTTWAKHLEQWPVRVDAAAKKAKTIKLVWDIALLVAATYQAAGMAAELVAAGRTPMPPLPVSATSGGGVAAAGINPAAYVELAEAIRKLIAAGALDAGVVVALSTTLGTGPAPGPVPPFISQMSAGQGTPGGEAAGNGIQAAGAGTRTAPNVTFSSQGAAGHGARHLTGTGLSREVVERAISAQIRSLSARAEVGGSFWGRVVVEGRTIEFRAFALEGGRINVGTYYPIP